MLQVDEAQKGIPISTLNPDTDGDGKVEKWEVEVFNRIKDADADNSGSISVKELFSVIKGAAESDRKKKLFKRAFFVALAVIVALIGAMLGMGIVAGEAVKESKVPDCSNPGDPRCETPPPPTRTAHDDPGSPYTRGSHPRAFLRALRVRACVSCGVAGAIRPSSCRRGASSRS